MSDILKLSGGAVVPGAVFCIAKRDGHHIIEIEGKYDKGRYVVNLLQTSAYKETYDEYGITADVYEWDEAVRLIHAEIQKLNPAYENTAQPAG